MTLTHDRKEHVIAADSIVIDRARELARADGQMLDNLIGSARRHYIAAALDALDWAGCAICATEDVGRFTSPDALVCRDCSDDERTA